MIPGVYIPGKSPDLIEALVHIMVQADVELVSHQARSMTPV
jgi:hypothetical protein